MRFAAEEQRVKVTGRTIFRDGIRYLGYTGTSISFRFNGKTAKAKLLSCFFINYPFVEMADYMNLLRFVDTKRLSFKFVLL